MEKILVLKKQGKSGGWLCIRGGSLEAGYLVAEAEVVEIVGVKTVLARGVVRLAVQSGDKLVAVELELQELGKGEEEGVVGHPDVGRALQMCAGRDRGKL